MFIVTPGFRELDPHLVPRRQKLTQQIGEALHALLVAVEVVADEEYFHSIMRCGSGWYAGSRRRR